MDLHRLRLIDAFQHEEDEVRVLPGF